MSTGSGCCYLCRRRWPSALRARVLPRITGRRRPRPSVPTPSAPPKPARSRRRSRSWRHCRPAVRARRSRPRAAGIDADTAAQHGCPRAAAGDPLCGRGREPRIVSSRRSRGRPAPGVTRRPGRGGRSPSLPVLSLACWPRPGAAAQVPRPSGCTRRARSRRRRGFAPATARTAVADTGTISARPTTGWARRTRPGRLAAGSATRPARPAVRRALR